MKNPSFYAGIFVSILFVFLMSLTLDGGQHEAGYGDHGHGDGHEMHDGGHEGHAEEPAEEAHH